MQKQEKHLQSKFISRIDFGPRCKRILIVIIRGASAITRNKIKSLERVITLVKRKGKE